MKYLALLLLVSCAPARFAVEVEHVSHPFAGWPFGPVDGEAQLTQANALLGWEHGGWYTTTGIGLKLYEKSQRDFVGPDLTGIVRVGKSWSLRR